MNSTVISNTAFFINPPIDPAEAGAPTDLRTERTPP